MSDRPRIVLSSDHAAIDLRQKIAAHIDTQIWDILDIGPLSGKSTHYPLHGEAAARRVASGDCALGIVLCGTGQGVIWPQTRLTAFGVAFALTRFRLE